MITPPITAIMRDENSTGSKRKISPAMIPDAKTDFTIKSI